MFTRIQHCTYLGIMLPGKLFAQDRLFLHRRLRNVTVGRDIRGSGRTSFASRIGRRGRRVPAFHGAVRRRWSVGSTAPGFLRGQAARLLRIKRVTLHHMRVGVVTIGRRTRGRPSFIARWGRPVATPVMGRRSSLRVVGVTRRWGTVGRMVRGRRAALIIGTRSHVVRRHGSNRLGSGSQRATTAGGTVIVSRTRTLPRGLRMHRRIRCNDRTGAMIRISLGRMVTARQGRSRRRHGGRVRLGGSRTHRSFHRIALFAARLGFHVAAHLREQGQRISVLLLGVLSVRLFKRLRAFGLA
jgi:hypothetical protein